MKSIESMFDNIYIRAITCCIMFVICIWGIGTFIAPQSQITYDRVVNETYAIIGEENISRIDIEDGCIHMYDNDGVLVSAGGVINKNGVEHTGLYNWGEVLTIIGAMTIVLIIVMTYNRVK